MKPTTELRLFELYRDYLWPLQRFLVKGWLSKRCKKCAISEHAIPLKKGICTVCRNHASESASLSAGTPALQEGLHDLLSKTAEQSVKRYHVLVLFSGGKDSTYLLHRLMTEYPKLSLVAFTADNTFMSQIAMENAETIVKKLGIEHIVSRPDESFTNRMFKQSLCNLNDKGGSGTVDQFDGDFMLDAGLKYAAANSIPLVLCGVSQVQIENIFKINSYLFPEDKLQSARHEIAGIKLDEIHSKREQADHWWQGKSEPYIPKLIFPFYAWNPAEHEVAEQVAKLDFIPSRRQSPLVTNNLLIPVMSIADLNEFGYSSFEPEFAKMIRRGKALYVPWRNTFELLEYRVKTGAFVTPGVRSILNRLALAPAAIGINSASCARRFRTIPELLASRARGFKSKGGYQISGDSRICNWKVFENRVLGTAKSLVGLGLKHGDRVLFLGENSIKWEVLHFAVACAGGIIITLDTNLDWGAELERLRLFGIVAESEDETKDIPPGVKESVKFTVLLHRDTESEGRIFSAYDLELNDLSDNLEPVDSESIYTMLIRTAGVAESFRHGEICREAKNHLEKLLPLPKNPRLTCEGSLRSVPQRISNLAFLMLDGIIEL